MMKHTSYTEKVNCYNLLKFSSVLPFLSIFVISLFVSSSVRAQSLSCHGQLNISLNSDCSFEVTPEAISTVSPPSSCGSHTIMLEDHYKGAISGNTLDYSHLGQLIKVKLIDNCTTNSCWGTILVEDKIAPSIDCGDVVNISCLEMDNYLPTISDCDPSAFVVQVGQTITLGDCDSDNDIIKTLERQYVAEDGTGNRSAVPCTQTINLIRIDTQQIIKPMEWINDDSFICGSEYPVDSLGHPHPDTTGIPILAFPNLTAPDTLIPLYPNISDACKARMTYEDFVVAKNGCLTKIMREWTYVDACSSYDDLFVHTQTIWIRDTKAPELIESHPIVSVGRPVPGNSNTHGWGVGNANCAFSVTIPPVSGSDNCSGIARYEVKIDGVLMLTQNGGVINLPADTFELRYIAFDGCGTSDSVETELIVLDAAAPVALCDRHTVVGLSTDGTVQVEAFVFDDGSFDDCGISKMAVTRKVNPAEEDFGPTITFECDDVDRENMVSFRVYDFTGRYNTCMITVEVQDKTGNVINCPGPQTIFCDHVLNFEDLSEFGEATNNSVCESKPVELSPDINIKSCNVGTITRKWASPNDTSTVACTQLITIENPFDFSFDDLDSILIMPKDVDTTGACGIELLPDNLPEGSQRPILKGSVCDLLGATYTDEKFIFDNQDGACVKILRNWTIINWCAEEGKNTRPVAQIIKVNNTEGPEVTLGDNPDEICTFDNECKEGTITLSASAVDDCSTDLRAIFYLDAGNDGTIDDTLNHSPFTPSASGSSGIDVSGNTTTVTIEKVFPIGTHRGIFTFIDECNNVSSKEHIFTIKNCKAPTCALIDGLSISLEAMDTDGDGVPDNEMACVWAKDFDASSVSACGGEVTFDFNEDQSGLPACFTCCDMGRNLIDVYVFDEFGNHALCTTSVTVNDHNDVNFCRFTANCPQPNVNVEACGSDAISPNVLGQPAIGGGCNCTNLRIPFNDVISTADDGCQLITRTWTVSCDGDFVDECVQTITVMNAVAPQLVDCPGHINMNLAGNNVCEAFINVRQPSVIQGCNSGFSITHNSPFADMQGANASGTYPVGTTNVTYTVTNDCNVSSTCTFSVSIRDNAPPVCNPRDITVDLREDGEVTVGPSQLDNGSEDACGDTFTAGSNMTFDCDDAGTTQEVVYFIEDESGNRVSCNANVTINDLDAPECNTRDRTVSLGTDGEATVNPTSLFEGAGGICNNFNVEGTPITFDCDDAGTTRTVTYTLRLNNGTSINCDGSVTIRDVDRPSCDPRNVTVTLGENGTVVVDPTTLQQGSTGSVCGDIEITGNPVTFDCDDAGTTSTVNYTITQTNGESMVCNASVTINNVDQPTCNATDVTVSLGDDGSVVVDPVTLHQGGGGSGVCGDVVLSGTPVTYTCCDAGETRTISYTINGNINCSASVTINNVPTASCQTEDVTTALNPNGTLNFNPASLYTGPESNCFDLSATNVGFDCDDAGTTVQVTYTLTSSCDNAELDCVGNVTIMEVGSVMIECPDDTTVDCGENVSDLSVFGNATATDGCGGNTIDPEESVVSNLGVCNMGVITRTFTATDANGETATCVQIITVSGPTNPVTESNITWPTSPFSVAGCPGVAFVGGRPVVDTGNAECSNISISSIDGNVVRNGNTACEGNIVRTWTVVDSCQLDGSGAGIFTFEQIFEFTDDMDPIIDLPGDISLAVQGDNCETSVDVPTIEAMDDCDPNPTVVNDSPFADVNSSGDISGIYPIGTHVVNITATDRCGNTTTSSITVTVTGSAGNFSFECKKRLINITDNRTAILHVDSIVCLTQSCEGLYTASFSNTDPNDVLREFTCDDIGPLNGFMSYVYLNGVLVDSCSTLQVIQDENLNCSAPLDGSDISGFIRTENGEGLGATIIDLDGSEFSSISTNLEGYYAFPTIKNGGAYAVVPEKDDDHLNGVSTLDIILIQKHILGLEKIESPYKLIAADINDSKSISVADIVELRKLILGVYDEFPENKSWKTLDVGFEFADKTNPFASEVPEAYDIPVLESDMEIDFVGVKVGDINGSAKTVNGRTTEVRSSSDVVFDVTSIKGSNGYSEYVFKSNDYENIEGFQFTIELLNNSSFVNIKPGVLNIKDENIGLRFSSKGLYTLSYNEFNARTSSEDEVLFTLVLKTENIEAIPFEINSVITQAEAYGSEIYGIDFNLENSQENSLVLMDQNNPNPWSNDTQIVVQSTHSMDARFTVYDISGRVLYRTMNTFSEGMNSIVLSKDDIKGYSGVAYYEILSNDLKLIKSMIVLE